MKCHAMTLDFRVLCGTRGHVYTLISGRPRDRLAQMITCKTCRRIWKRLTS